MNGLYFFVLLIVIASTFVSAVPVEQDSEGNLVHLRQRRATCDLLSFELPKFKLNDSACAAHCLVLGKGFKGGNCKNGVCHCRK